ncbi:hypothetical protein LCGC14_0313080 [marine sediment metagenome]|uniref:Uncharacterized protein n=1 Tax=marine sediment metagenome TaxID=412755 RepID=A0A0F9W8N6_9ZZZZ
MTNWEAEAVATAIAVVDGRCSFCAGDVADALTSAGLGWRWVVVKDEEEGWRVAVTEGNASVTSAEGQQAW